MECKDCGASNLDGAERCSACGSSLLGDDGGSGSQRPTGAQNSTLLLGAVIAVAAVAVVVMLMSSGTGGGGGGSVSGPDSVESTGSVAVDGATSLPPTSDIATLPVTPEQRAELVRVVQERVDADYPAYSGISPSVARYSSGGRTFAQVSFGLPDDTSTTDIPAALEVIVDEDSKEMRFYVSD